MHVQIVVLAPLIDRYALNHQAIALRRVILLGLTIGIATTGSDEGLILHLIRWSCCRGRGVTGEAKERRKADPV